MPDSTRSLGGALGQVFTSLLARPVPEGNRAGVKAIVIGTCWEHYIAVASVCESGGQARGCALTSQGRAFTDGLLTIGACRTCCCRRRSIACGMAKSTAVFDQAAARSSDRNHTAAGLPENGASRTSW